MWAVWMYPTGFIQILLFGWKVNPVHKPVLNLFWTFPAAYAHKSTAQLSSLSALFGDFMQHPQLDKISGVQGKEATTG